MDIRNDPLNEFLNEEVVIDTDGPIVYVGTLMEVTEWGLSLADADVHDCRDGHAHKEAYLVETLAGGVTVNRRKVVVMRRVILSVSRLNDVVVEEDPEAPYDYDGAGPADADFDDQDPDWN